MSIYERSSFLREIRSLRDNIPSLDQYPFHLSSIRYLEEPPLHPKVTYIVGENGTGKSTLLEALAVAWGFNAEGGKA
ncbi:AAA family ATPase [Paenibacillus sp. P26]|nr:AAA family ATPase [Paenibacillus sp. P26]